MPTTPAIPGLSHRVRVERFDHDGVRQDFDYLRVTGDTVEDALSKVAAHHAETYQVPEDQVRVYHLGFNIDDRPVPSLQTLVRFDHHGDHGFEWEVGFYGTTETSRWRTDSRGTGLWRWDGQSWKQTHGHLQWGLPGSLDEAREWLCARWGLTEATVTEDADLLTADQVLTRLDELGRPISLKTLRNYTSRPPAGWPQPAKRIGRTPLWSRTAIDTYASP